VASGGSWGPIGEQIGYGIAAVGALIVGAIKVFQEGGERRQRQIERTGDAWIDQVTMRFQAWDKEQDDALVRVVEERFRSVEQRLEAIEGGQKEMRSDIKYLIRRNGFRRNENDD
jgi:hypothetical protein